MKLLVEEVIQLFAPEAQLKQLRLQIEVAAGVPEQSLADPARVRQLLTNLLGNAVKFTAAGGIIVRLKRDKDGGLRCEVEDTGIGIAGDFLPRLFEPFSQANETSTRQHGGAGLGLAVSRHIVELIGGQMGADNRPDQGTIFWFTIPLSAPRKLPETRSAA